MTLDELLAKYAIQIMGAYQGATELGVDDFNAKAQIEALIATQIQEAKLKELEDFRNSWHTMIRQEVHQDLNDRIAHLRSTVND